MHGSLLFLVPHPAPSQGNLQNRNSTTHHILRRHSMKTLPFLILLGGATVLLSQTDSQSADRNEITGLIQQMAQMDAKNLEPSAQFIHDHLAEDLVYV
jgi:hypothetical protein